MANEGAPGHGQDPASGGQARPKGGPNLNPTRIATSEMIASTMTSGGPEIMPPFSPATSRVSSAGLQTRTASGSTLSHHSSIS